MKKVKKLIVFISILLLFIYGIYSLKFETKEIVLADAGWDSIQFHNQIVSIILENAFDVNVREMPGSSAILHEGILCNEVDIHMEMWTDNLRGYYEDLEDDLFKEVSVNFDDNKQGFYVPRYVIEGDSKRNIEPMCEDLEYVWDLEKYKDIFEDEEVSSMGRIYGALPGWEADEILYKKYKEYGLDKTFRYFRPGSEAALATAFTSAYEKGEPIVGYYWEPTWLMGMYDFVLLKDNPFNESTYKTGITEMPSVRVTVGVSNSFYNEYPEITNFLKKYETSSTLTSEALAYMQKTNSDAHETAIWFLKKYPEFLTTLLDDKQVELVNAYLNIN